MNVSEGRDTRKLQAIADEIEASAESWLLSSVADPDHHRAVFSFIGTPASISEAAFATTQRALTLIDVRNHCGVHPRIGAVDTVPFIPIKGVSMQDCVDTARRFGKRIANELGVPVYLYEQASLRPERRHLSRIRKGEFERLVETVRTDPGHRPDFGPARLHPTAGAMAVGARHLLIAFNIYLNTREVAAAQQIADRIRESGGGLPGVRALGFYLPRRNQAQVSMNVTDYHRAPLLQIYERVSREAAQLGLNAVSSELIGLVPREALPQTIQSRLRLENFHPRQILEDRIVEVLQAGTHRAGEENKERRKEGTHPFRSGSI